jgi:hypothetical protein
MEAYKELCWTRKWTLEVQFLRVLSSYPDSPVPTLRGAARMLHERGTTSLTNERHSAPLNPPGCVRRGEVEVKLHFPALINSRSQRSAVKPTATLD